ncbi:hypothetical protein BGX33_010706 [Mortierella sp. NVP41]|nr:hypothetical protein BGX33_010706 [Mortierella sp. NVP41]
MVGTMVAATATAAADAEAEISVSKFSANPPGGMALHTSTDLYGDLADRNDDNIDQETNNNNNAKATTATATVQPTSKFDLYKAQMDRVRSSHRLHGRSASASTSFPTTTTANVGEGISGGGQLPFPSTPSSSCSPPTSPTIYTSSSSSAASFAPSKKSSHGGLFPKKLFKKPSLSNNKSKSRGTQSPTSGGAGVSRSSLLVNEKQQTVDPSHRHSVSLSRSVSRSADHPTTSSPTTPQQQRSPIEEQQDRWREEWLRPSGAIHSMFRDGPSKFNCPHCGAIKVVSNIQFVPGLMSYLVAFGLMFLTLGTLSYLPFRKDHEGTKDCIHWCPECERKVARFNRANSTWEWI